jgi:hypothetical protein
MVARVVGCLRDAFGGNMVSGSQFFVVAFGRTLASVVLKMYSYLIYAVKNFINCVLSM